MEAARSVSSGSLVVYGSLPIGGALSLSGSLRSHGTLQPGGSLSLAQKHCQNNRLEKVCRSRLTGRRVRPQPQTRNPRRHESPGASIKTGSCIGQPPDAERTVQRPSSNCQHTFCRSVPSPQFSRIPQEVSGRAGAPRTSRLVMALQKGSRPAAEDSISRIVGSLRQRAKWQTGKLVKYRCYVGWGDGATGVDKDAGTPNS